MACEIAQLRKEQIGDLGVFLHAAYPEQARKHSPQFLEWYFLRNPNQSIEDIPLWVVLDQGKIVGQLATILVRLKVGNSYTDAIWILEFILLEQYRGQGLGKKLVRAAEHRYPTMITLGINEASTRVFDSLGWQTLGGIHRYHKLLFAGNAAGEVGNKNIVREAMNALSYPLRFSVSRTKLQSRYEIKHERSFAPELDEFWDRASKQWPVAVRRDHLFVAWQFLRQPGKVFEMIRLYDHGKLVGYAVLFFRRGIHGAPPPKAAISDIVYDCENPDEVIVALLQAALKMALERRAGSLVTDVLDPRLEVHLRSYGFSRIKNSPRFMAASAEFGKFLHAPENWYLTRADSDVSIFEEPNVIDS